MDYRHTEDFARQIEDAALRAPGLRAQAVSLFWGAVFAGIGRGWRALRHRFAKRSDTLLPEA